MKIKRLLVANRGEIAIRIMRTCKEMDIIPIAIFSEVDRNSLHIKFAQEAYYIGDSSPEDSYLNIDKIISIAQKYRVDAIHPGYGFLAENADFAEACEENNIIFIGPTSKVIANLGDKLVARQIARDSGVVTIPGADIRISDFEHAKKIAKEISYPILIKAAFGGGGKGMRIARNQKELEDNINIAKSEAKFSFKNDAIYIEKYLNSPKHIEFQILADNFGNVIHLFERECSIQRRHQKVVEESPSLHITTELRKKMGAIAVRLAKASNYSNAGTVEFLVDKNKNFYFLEINTRIQVEHPITELTTGVDFVREQINIASNKPLYIKQTKLNQIGHAIEMRIYAEDPYNNFAPSLGSIKYLKNPDGPGIRLDSGIYEGYNIPVFYDPIIAKLCAWGPTREIAIARIKRAVSEYEIIGVKTNIYLHKQILNDPIFIKGSYTTEYLENNLERLLAKDNDNVLHAIIASALINENSNSVISRTINYEKSKWKHFGRICGLRQ